MNRFLAMCVLVFGWSTTGFPNEGEPVVRNWIGSLYGGFNTRRGNTTESACRYGGDFEKKNGALYRYKVLGSGRYCKTENRVSNSKADLSGEMRRLLGKRWFIPGRASAAHDDVRELSYRVKAGPGVGYYLFDSDKLRTDVTTGLLFTQEKSAGEESDYMAWRLSQRLDWQVTETLKCWVGTESFMNTTDSDDYQVSLQSGVENRINCHLSLLVELENEYDNTPNEANSIEKNDLEISTGLRYRF